MDDKDKFDVMNELSPMRREQLKDERCDSVMVKPKLGVPSTPSKENRSMPRSSSSSSGKLISGGSGIYKMGMGSSDNKSVTSVRTMPRVYSPLFELSNLQLPRDRRTLNAWCRHFYATHPIVRNCINLHSTFPISKFEFMSDDPQILKEVQDLSDEMRLPSVLYSVALTYWLLGESFPYGDWDENNAKWRRWVVHNPDYIDVKYSTVMAEPIITLQPDDTLKRVVRGGSSRDRYIRATLPKEIIYYISRGMNIPLDNFNVTHVKALSEPYDHRGTSIIASCFKDLMLYDLLRESEYAQASNMINPLTLIKLGDPLGRWRPNDEDIAAFQDLYVDMQFDLDPKIITHGAVNIEKIGNSGAIVDVSPKMERIEKNIFSGMMVPPALINGEGPNYCYDEETETLTNNGFKFYDEITEDDKILTLNPDNHELEYLGYAEKIVSHYKGDMIHFKTKVIDIMVTPNHKMYIQERADYGGEEREWVKKEAKDVALRSRTLAYGTWRGETPDKIPFGGFEFTPTEFVSLLLYTWTRSRLIDYNGKKCIAFFASPFGPSVEWRDAMVAIDAQYSSKNYCYVSDSQELKEACLGQMGNIFHEWKIPRLIGNWAAADLEKALDRIFMVLAFRKHFKDPKAKNKYLTKAWFSSYDKSLLDTVSEMLFKLGYFTKVYSEYKPRTDKIIYKMVFSKKSRYKTPVIDNHGHKTRITGNSCKTNVKYDGMIYSFDVPPNHLFVTRRNGIIAIQGNSTASVSLEVLRQRYLMFRDEMSNWIRQKVLKPIAEARDWSKEGDGKNKTLMIPRVQWNKLNLKDLQDYMQKVMDAVGKEAASKESLLRVLDMDPNEELARRRKELIQEVVLQKEKAALYAYTLGELKDMDENSIIKEKPGAVPAQPGIAGGPGGPGGELGGGLGMPGGMPGLGEGGLGGMEGGGGLEAPPLGGEAMPAPPGGGEVGGAGGAPPAPGSEGGV